MSTGLPSDEVAEDYKGALEDLVTNDRYQINNLTMIAKENIEHAEAISRVLQNHIKRAPPTRKLPALYVLDSLAKNIGSPYTIYFGRNLYDTFMLAYSQVDSNVRRKLEEMLRTWREPVPGSLSTTPVFPIASTQTIVDMLSKHRASTAPNVNRYQQSPAPGIRTPHMQQVTYRDTPTPPQAQLPVHPHYGVSTPQPQMPQYMAQPQAPFHVAQTIHQYQAPTPQPQSGYAAPQTQAGPPPSSVDLQKLHADIDDLTTDAKIECATHPMDSGAQQKLTTLQTLKEILDSGSASEQDLIDIRSTIGQEMAKKMAAKQQAQPPPPPQPQPQQAPMPFLAPPMPYIQSQSHGQYPPPQQAPQPSFLNSNSLAELLRATSTARSTPQPPSSYPMPYQPPASQHQYNTPPVSYATPVPAPSFSIPPSIPSGAMPLLEQLRASGLLSATATPPPSGPPPLGLASMLHNATLEVRLTTTSIKIPRPQMVTSFLNERPNQCSTCGKRFTSDDVGREKKTRHLDWHFKTKARMIDAEKRGQNRSWYVDEREWISMKEFDDDAGMLDDNAATTDGLSPSSVMKKKKPEDYVRAPSDPALRNAPCPIDQEPFRSEWSEEVQDFIWKDAIRVGNRYYHASCYREATKDRDNNGGATSNGAGTGRTGTPDSVLGKRKAEYDTGDSVKSKVKLEA